MNSTTTTTTNDDYLKGTRTMNLGNLPSRDLYAIAALLRAAAKHSVELQYGWLGPLADVFEMSYAYERAAWDAEHEGNDK
jgi:hypothetical protein